VTFVGDSRTDETFEQQLFLPMTADEYLKKFSYQN
jgi:hypothetical protein